MSPRPVQAVLAIVAILLAWSAPLDAERLALTATSVDLPGAPSSIIATDLDNDGRPDLAVVVAYTEWDQIGVTESSEMEGIEGLVEVLTIVPALNDRRELRFYRGTEDGSYQAAGEPMELPLSVLSLERGPKHLPLLALTDEGVAAVRWDGQGAPRLEPLVQEAPVHAGSGSYLPNLDFVQDLDGDAEEDLMLPGSQGLAIYLSRGGGFQLASRVLLPGDETDDGEHYVPLPEVRDVTGDRLPDLLVAHRNRGWREFHVLKNLGDGKFAQAVEPLEREAEQRTAQANGVAAKHKWSEDDLESVYFGDLDGDGMAEWVQEAQVVSGKDGIRHEMREAKRPEFERLIYHVDDSLAPRAQPYTTFQSRGYAFGGGDELRMPGGFQDLDGDGRLDLVSLTLDFSMLQLLRVATTQTLSLGIDFHIWCQNEDGSFSQVSGLDLSGKLRFNLRNLRIGQLSQFEGDFDGDGRVDFVQLGRGRTVTIHRGQEGCSFPARPDLSLRLKEEPRNVMLVQVRDLDGDQLADLLVIQPRKAPEPGVSPPARLDLYVSGAGSANKLDQEAR